MQKVMAVLRGPGQPDVEMLCRASSAVSRLDGCTVDVVTAEAPVGVLAVASLWLPGDDVPDPRTLYRDAEVDGYLVDERVQWDYERDWPVGRPSPGVKRISFVRRAGNLSRDEFAHHWSDVHAHLAARHHPSLWRYVQNVVVEPITGGAPEVDGIAELSFRSIEDLRDRMYDSDEGRAVIGADVRRFIDVPKGWRALTRETVVIVPGSGPG